MKLNSAIKLIINYFLSFIIFKSKYTTKKTILLVRLDGIGDYVLFRNFIKILKNSKQYKDYKITLIGNIAWKSISEKIDIEYIDNFIWLDVNKFNNNFFYRYKNIKEISCKGYELVLNPVYSRDFYTDIFVKQIKSHKKIGSSGDLSNIKSWQKNISDCYYTELIPADNELMFEFYRNKEFFQTLLKEKLEIKKPFIEITNIKSPIILPKNYVVLFLGAGANFRKWSVKNFIEVSKFIQKIYELDIVVCGDYTDQESAKDFDFLFNRGILNLVGKTTLFDILNIINSAELLIANETSIPHFAVALDVKNILVISNGNHLGRFTPYPKELTDKYHVIYHPNIENNLSDYRKFFNNYGYGSQLNINDIEAKDVINKVNNILGYLA